MKVKVFYTDGCVDVYDNVKVINKGNINVILIVFEYYTITIPYFNIRKIITDKEQNNEE